ncbi:WW domain-binding protein 1 [Liparis tanakae]|uniref:WW domain-binding protein 1 n=1 Tax=Liparis tanakae TaxID=230148 RepID=A0A4Z2IT26_9TELE|nr:WW domain-binding protein 1 [Liparis tanakae]
MPQKALGSIVGLLCTGTCLVQGKEFCFGVNNEQYRCEMGYCCGETECCTYYYELWWFWNDCKLPDYEEVVGHPPTPPPPYSENPLETTPALIPQVSQPDAAVPRPLPEADLRVESQASGSSDQEAVAMLIQGEENVEASLMVEEEEEEEEDEELVTRRRHVTGDSGIEVCVCQLDVDEGSGLEEESDEEHRMCKATGQDCCSGQQRQTFRQKERPSEPPSQTASSSTGDHMV